MNRQLLKILSTGSPDQIKINFESYTIQRLQSIRNILDDKYYNSKTPLISDYQYDIFYDYILSRNPTEIQKVGARIRENITKAALPYWMGSLDKKKESKTIDRWVSKYKGEYLISEKLDGISLLLEICNGSVKLYTRGDGKIGSDITHLYSYLNFYCNGDKVGKDLVSLQQPTPLEGHLQVLYIRGELVVSSENYQKYRDTYDNPRQMVSGIVNAKTLKKGIEVIDFIAYQIMNSDECISNQYRQLQHLKFTIPQYVLKKSIDTEILTEILCNMKKTSSYAIDGIVVTDNAEWKTNTSGNPDHSWAYKISGKSYEATVEDVEWNISKSGVLKPTIKINPVKMEDVSVSYVTGFNAKYIRDNGIGKDCIIKIIRSGDVIPHIVGVVKSVDASFPTRVDYQWNSTGVDIIANTTGNKDAEDEYHIKYLSSFCTGLGILNLGKSTITKLYNNGWNTLYKILDSKKDSFTDIQGLGKKSSERIYLSIQECIPKVTLAQFIGVSGMLGQGIGEKKVASILEKYPDIFLPNDNPDTYCLTQKPSMDEYRQMLKNIKGFSTISIDKVLENIEKTIEFVKLHIRFFCWLQKNVEHPKKQDKLKDWKVVFTGFRDKDLENRIVQLGGEVTDRVVKCSSHLVVKDLNGKSTSKIEKARENGLKIVDRQFIRDFLNSLD